MYPSVIDVVPRANFMLDITFSNSESGVLDMKPSPMCCWTLCGNSSNNFRNFEVMRDFKVYRDQVLHTCLHKSPHQPLWKALPMYPDLMQNFYPNGNHH